jgi:peptidoglycan hydrolase CwlO-like protein
MRVIFLALILLNVLSCKRNRVPEVDVDNKPQSQSFAGEKELDRLQRERNDLLNQLEARRVEGAEQLSDLTLERDELNAQRTSLQAEIARLQNELNARENASSTEKTELQKKLDDLNMEKQNLDKKLEDNAAEIKELLKKIETLTSDNKSLNEKIAALNAKIDQLNKELADERSREESASGTSSTATGSETPAPAAPSSNTPTTQPTANGPTSSTSPTSSTATVGTVSTLAWQFLKTNADGAKSCFEFGSTIANASLLGLNCVSPAPIRQLFKTESFGNQFLLIDQRTSMCVRLDSAATDRNTARILLGNCLRGGNTDELWQFHEVNIETKEFKIRSVRTNLCLSIGSDRKVAQISCTNAAILSSMP